MSLPRRYMPREQLERVKERDRERDRIRGSHGNRVAGLPYQQRRQRHEANKRGESIDNSIDSNELSRGTFNSTFSPNSPVARRDGRTFTAGNNGNLALTDEQKDVVYKKRGGQREIKTRAEDIDWKKHLRSVKKMLDKIYADVDGPMTIGMKHEGPKYVASIYNREDHGWV